MIKRILIVDDQVSVLVGLSKALHRYCNYPGEIKAVENCEEALNAITSSFYDICFLDINLPDISGLDLMEIIHVLSPETRIVIMTASYVSDETKKKIEEGASLFLPKPIELDTVKSFIDEEMRKIGSSHAEESAGYNDIKEKRLVSRIPYKKTVCCSICVFFNWELKSNLEADMIDISNGGAGLKACYPLYPGNVIRFDNVLENKSGIVKWSVKCENYYRAGIKFI